MPDMMKMLKHLEKAIPQLKKLAKDSYSEKDMKEMGDEEDMELHMLMMDEDEMPMPRRKRNHKMEDDSEY